MRRAACRGPAQTASKIEYEVLGEPKGTPLLLIAGLGAQLTAWDDLCVGLAQRGFRVIRFDHRDAGLSTRLDEAGVPNYLTLGRRLLRGKQIDAAYTLWDMVDDVAGLLDELRLPSAHVVGVSMGGMVGQCLAVRYPGRVESLTSIMSSVGVRELFPPTREATMLFLSPTPSDKAGSVERAVKAARMLSGGAFPFDAKRARRLAERNFDRGFCPQGAVRHFVAILAAGSWRERLVQFDKPALVIHGDADRLVPLAGGLRLHEALPTSEMMIIPGLGHELPVGVWPQVIDAIDDMAHVRPPGDVRRPRLFAGLREAWPLQTPGPAQSNPAGEDNAA